MLNRNEIAAIGRPSNAPVKAVAVFAPDGAPALKMCGLVAAGLGEANGWTDAQVEAATAALGAAPRSYQLGAKMWPVDLVAIAEAAAR